MRSKSNKIALFSVFSFTEQPCDDNSVESIIETNKSIGDCSDDICDKNQQKTLTVNQPTQISIGTVSTGNVEQQYQQSHIHQQASNIILIRGARTENGQIILQNGHELLSLLNSGAVNISNNDDEKGSAQQQSILLQNSRIQSAVLSTSKQLTNDSGKFVIQSGIKNSNQIIDTNALSGSGIKNNVTNTVFLHSSNVIKKKTTVASALSAAAAQATAVNNSTSTIPEGSIILQQRLNKNGTSDGPILLQTLKRLDKSQSILLFRNAQTTNTANCTLSTTNSINTRQQITVVGNKSDEKSDTKTKSISSNTPLGTGMYKKKLLYF